MRSIKVWEYQDPTWGIAFKRISNELHKNSPPWVEWVQNQNEAELHIIHIVGPGEMKLCSEKSVIVQHCYLTAGGHDYISLWKNARLTISFHNLPDYTEHKFNFLRLPWGADPEIFRHINHNPRNAKVLSTGHIAVTECIDKIYDACKAIDGIMLHTGGDFRWERPFRFLPYMNIDQLVTIMNSVQYIPGLREHEGFEIMCVEGLFCGARAIVPDLPTYDFYKGHAEFIDMKGNITEQLIAIMSKEPRPVTEEERAILIEKFSWKNICGKFYNKLETLLG